MLGWLNHLHRYFRKRRPRGCFLLAAAGGALPDCLTDTDAVNECDAEQPSDPVSVTISVAV